MQIIGFQFTKISAERTQKFSKKSIHKNYHIEFIDLDKESIPFLSQFEGTKLLFKYTLSYTDEENTHEKKENHTGEIAFEGFIVLSLTDEETKEFQKSWKKKLIPEKFQLSLSNFVLNRCSVKALELGDLVNLPSHIPIPQLSRKDQ